MNHSLSKDNFSRRDRSESIQGIHRKSVNVSGSINSASSRVNLKESNSFISEEH